MLQNNIHNVIFITLDSCTLESAQMAKLPNLNLISRLKIAETNGTYTYPAHHAFLIGNLPVLTDDNCYFENYKQIWRSSSARNTDKDVFVHFNSKNIIQHYESLNYDVWGYGGVSFFDKNNPNNTLPQLFKNFDFFKHKNSGKDIKKIKRVPRNKMIFPLNNLDTILGNISEDNPFFIFINSPETHIPYDSPISKVTNKYSRLIDKLYAEHYLGTRYNKHLPFTHGEIEEFKSSQINSLEWVDAQIGKLLKKIPKKYPTLVIVCSDHGEEFGEGGRFGHAHNHPTIMNVPLWCNLINNR